MKTTILTLIFLLPLPLFAQEKKESEYTFCSSTKEYLTTFNYLEKQEVFKISPLDRKKLSQFVAKGCDGSAERFILIVDLLTKAGVDTTNAILLGKDFALANDKKTSAFITIFKEAFLQQRLDLDLHYSLELAKKLSLEIESKEERVKNDFQEITNFCLDEDKIPLPHKNCAELALMVAKLGDKFQVSLSKSYLEAFDFLTDEEGINATSIDALNMAKRIIDYGPLAFKNFKESYLHIIKHEENSHKQNAIQFAFQMVELSLKRKSDDDTRSDLLKR